MTVPLGRTGEGKAHGNVTLRIVGKLSTENVHKGAGKRVYSRNKAVKWVLYSLPNIYAIKVIHRLSLDEKITQPKTPEKL